MTIAFSFKHLFIGSVALSLIAIGYFTAAPQAQALTSLSQVQPGDLIRGTSFSSVYYMGSDGFRYVFPNSNTYFTWYNDFNNVKFLSDSDLSKIQIGGNVTYRPGVKMVKINTDPKTYAVDQGGNLRHVGSEAVAVALYGSTWNQQIHDMPDAFFGNYKIGTAITSASDFNPAAKTAAVTNINIDKGIAAPKDVSISVGGFSPSSVTISVGQTVRFTNNHSTKHTATAEDLTWGTGTLEPGQSFIKRFDKAGTYGYFDSYDSTKSGAIFVQ